jgi:hypothetical protein
VYAASQRQRALERAVRRAARRYHAAISPEGRARAKRAWQAAQRAAQEHQEAHGLRMTKIGAHRREHPFDAH